MEGRIRVDAVSHAAFCKVDLRDEDKPLLDDVAKVISSNCPRAVMTVEGFSTDRVHTVSYGKPENRRC